MKKAKGTLLKPLVKGIKADKSGAYDDILTDEDKKVISERIFDAAWYPFETYKRLFNAVAKVFAKGNLETIRKWGVNTGKEIMEKVYKTTYSHKDLKSALKLYDRLFNLWFKGCKHSTEHLSDNEANITYEDFDPDFEYFYHTARGWIEASINHLLGKKIFTEFIAKSWEGDKATIIKITLPMY